MEASSVRIRTITLIASGLWILSILVAGYSIRINTTLKDDLHSQKVKSEALLSEKLLLEKDIIRYKKELQTLQESNSQMGSLVASIKEQLEEKEKFINGFKKKAANLQALESEVAMLRKSKKELEAVINSLYTQVSQLKEQNAQWEKEIIVQRQTSENLGKENKDLKDYISLLNSMANTSRMEASKRNEKLTAKAKRSQKLTLYTEVPHHLLDNLDFKISSPSSEVFTSTDGTVSIKTVSTAKAETTWASTQKAERAVQNESLQIEFTPKKKMEKGIYKVEVYHHNIQVGQMQIRLQ